MPKIKRAIKDDRLHYLAPDPRPPQGKNRFKVPESITLQVSPSACARRLKIDAICTSDPDSCAALYVSPEDVSASCYENLVPDAVEQLLDCAVSRPRAVIILTTCIDDILGTDHEVLKKSLRERFPDVYFCTRRVDPLCFDMGMPPPANMLLNYFSMVDWSGPRTDSVTLIGNMAPMAKSCEMPEVFGKMGLQVKEISGCETFDQFLELGKSRLNIAITPIGIDAGMAVEKEHGIPYRYCPRPFSPENIIAFYRQIGEATGREVPDLTPYVEQCNDWIAKAKAALGSMSLVIDSYSDFRPASLARALIEQGFPVKILFARVLFDADPTDLNWIRENHPETKVVSGTVLQVDELKKGLGETVAIGYSVGYMLGSEHLVQMDGGTYGYGFGCLCDLMKDIITAAGVPADYAGIMKQCDEGKPQDK